MLAAAAARGERPESVDSVYLRGEEAIKEHERRNGYDKEWGVNGVQRMAGDGAVYVPEGRGQAV